MLFSANSPSSTGVMVGAALVCCVVLLVVALKVIKPILSLGSSVWTVFH
jgi:hypothetical protein